MRDRTHPPGSRRVPHDRGTAVPARSGVNTIELTLLRADRFGDDALLLTVWDDGVPVGASLQTPPYPLACNGIPVAAHRSVAVELARIRPDLSGVRGRRDPALAFADAWHAETGVSGTITTSEMLYRLGTLRAPIEVSGAYREATTADRALLVDWLEHFFAETFSHQRDGAAGARFIDTANAVGDRFVLWDDGGTPVSMAMLRAPAAGVSRIGPVFTPQNSRGRGYGSAVTAVAADLARRGGVEAVLFADLANPTSNGIYRRIGFGVASPTRCGSTLKPLADHSPHERAQSAHIYRRVLVQTPSRCLAGVTRGRVP